jgi:hypothetical protein
VKVYSITNLLKLILFQECYFFYIFGQSLNSLTHRKARVAFFRGQREYVPSFHPSQPFLRAHGSMHYYPSQSPSFFQTKHFKSKFDLSMAASMKEVAASTMSTPFLGLQHGELGFEAATLRRRWCRHYRIIFSSHFSVLSWLDPTTVKGW